MEERGKGMRILITTDWYKPVINGVVTSVQNLAEQLRNRGHEVKILTLSSTCHSYKEENVFYAGSVGVGYVYPQARLRIPDFGRYWKELLEWEPQIIHSQCEFSTFYLAKKIAKEKQIPIVHTYHTIYEDYTHYFSPKQTWGKGLVQLMTRRLSGHVGELIAPSEKIKHILEGYQVSCPVTVLPSGIDLGKYDSGKEQKIRKKLQIPKEKTVLLYVGRLAREKNLEELLQYQKAAHPYGTILLIVGDGPYKEVLEEETKGLGICDSVIFTGMISPEKVPDYYQAGDLFVSASRSETQGMTYAEALASGLPLLCRKDECLESVVQEGVNGWQYEDMDGFLKFIQLWKGKSRHEKQDFCLAAQKSAEKFSAAKFAERMEKIYEKWTGAKRKAA